MLDLQGSSPFQSVCRRSPILRDADIHTLLMKQHFLQWRVPQHPLKTSGKPAVTDFHLGSFSLILGLNAVMTLGLMVRLGPALGSWKAEFSHVASAFEYWH